MSQSAALDEVQHILESVNSQDGSLPGTLLYNEGWLLRLALSAGSKGTEYSTSLEEFYKLCLEYNAGADQASSAAVRLLGGDAKLLPAR